VNAHTVLIVDDEAAIRRVLDRALTQAGYGVFTAASGEEAFEILSGNAVDLVLMDLRMPRMSGRTLFHTIRSQWPHMADRIVVTSGDPEAPEHRDWLQMHALPILPKPFELDYVLDVVAARLAVPRREANGTE
jgi:DNA-binding NtrC family response regulator